MLRLGPAWFLVALLGGTVCSQDPSPPVIGGLARDGLEARVRGLVLMGELSCAACHDPGRQRSQVDPKLGPKLSRVGSRVDPDFLREFLADPHAVKPGTTMPDVMGSLSPADRASAADALTHYLVSRSLVSKSTAPFTKTPPDRVARARGKELFHSIGCAACHAPRDDAGLERPSKDSVPLGALHEKYSIAGLSEFLRAPHLVRPAGRMPDFALKPQEVYDLSHYLLASAKVGGRLGYTLYLQPSMEGSGPLRGQPHRSGLVSEFSLGPWRDLREDFAVEFSGYLTVLKTNTYQFEIESDGAARLRVGTDQQTSVGASGGVKLRARLEKGRHRVTVTYVHKVASKRDRRLDVHWSESGMPRSPLRLALFDAERVPPEPFVRFVPDAAKVAKGRGLFARLGCARCHAMDDAELPRSVEAAPIRQLSTDKGCLSTRPGRWPDYALSAAQRREIRAAMADIDQRLTGSQSIDKTLTALNCLACHQRGKLGGVPESRLEFFGSHELHLGEAGRLPPPLTGVGAKLQKGWLVDAIAHGQSVRPYVKTRMPGFGVAHGERLANLLRAADRLPPVEFDPMPRDRKKRRVITDAGHKLSGNQGMNCIACHTFRGQRASDMAAVDLIETTTQRLTKEWFYHYMMAPVQFSPGTLMPQYFPNGVSARADILGGDAKAQLHAMWEYLAEGRNTRAPRGLSRPPMEVSVGAEAVMLRRSAQNTGKRGISVGLPTGVSYTFDAETIALNQVWWGKFIDTGGVFRGQGSGQVRVIGRQRVTLPKGPAFVVLGDADAGWPSATRRELGHRFRGYDLDDKRRPIFRYECEGVEITDAPRELPAGDAAGGSTPRLRRTLTLRSAKDKTLFFRAASDARIEKAADGRFEVGKSLVIAVSGGAASVRAAGDEKELVVKVPVVDGKAGLVLEYGWKERVK